MPGLETLPGRQLPCPKAGSPHSDALWLYLQPAEQASEKQAYPVTWLARFYFLTCIAEGALLALMID